MTSRYFEERQKEFNKPITAFSRLHQSENVIINFGTDKIIISTSNRHPSIIANPLKFCLGVM